MFNKWCEVTSCNGIVDLYESKENGNKCGCRFWAVIVTCGILTTVGFVYRTIEGYISTPYVTNVALVTKNALEMPDVMMCYMGGMNVSAFKREGFGDNFIVGFSTAISDGTLGQKEEFLKSVQQELEDYLKSKSVSVMDLIQTVGYGCKEIVEFFKNETSDEKTSCASATRLFDGRSGQCFIFKNNDPQMYPDGRGGISFMMKQPANSFVSIYNPTETQNNVGYMSDGFAITLEKTMGLQRTGRSVSIPLNVKAEIVLNTKRYIRLGKNAACDNRPEIYSSNSCFYNCYVDSVYDNCGCLLLSYADQKRMNGTTPVCSPFTDTDVCNGRKHRECQSKCQPKCDEWIFESSISYTTMTNENRNVNRSLISIAYQTMQYTEILEVDSFSIDMAIANVGGQLGLWLGASIVTLIQAAYYLFLNFCNRRNSSVQNIVLPDKGTYIKKCLLVKFEQSTLSVKHIT